MISFLFVSLNNIVRAIMMPSTTVTRTFKSTRLKIAQAGEGKAIFFVIKVRDWIGVLIGCLIFALVFEPKERLH